MRLVLRRGGPKRVAVLVHMADRWSLGSAGVLLWMRWGKAGDDNSGVTGSGGSRENIMEGLIRRELD
ncbi:hypothetical protein E2562_017461 [Oryza meyeriana var. granulata]|uniref:Uncharacterized protein n=1 Tax=Oryza meyeriana var. granulata TaxID=110450 RepID=A0A6G1DWQ6_9ORYZ|nr:hypothetical protein E2562_017461 [Oryza meyeriana var. granulata]